MRVEEYGYVWQGIVVVDYVGVIDHDFVALVLWRMILGRWIIRDVGYLVQGWEVSIEPRDVVIFKLWYYEESCKVIVRLDIVLGCLRANAASSVDIRLQGRC